MRELIDNLKENVFITYVYIYIFLMPWNFFNGQMGILSVLLFIFWLKKIINKDFKTEMKKLFSFPPVFCLSMFFIFVLLSLLWTENIKHAFAEDIKFYKYYLLVLPILFTSISDKEALLGIKVFLVSLCFYAIFSIAIYLGLVYSFSDQRGILPYSIVTPYMAIGLLSSIIFFFQTKDKQRMLFFVCTLFFLIALFINQGRAGQLAFVITLFILLLVNYKILFKNMKYLILSTFIIIIAIYTLSNNGKLDRLQTGFNELTHIEESNFSGSWGYRAYMWYAAWDIFKKNPIIGVGAGDNIDEFRKYAAKNPSNATWLGTFHNQHLDYITKYGIIGYSLFISSLFLLIFYARKNLLIFNLSIIFFSITFFDALGDVLLHMKPYNNIFILLFTLVTIIILKNNEKKDSNGTMV